MRVWLDDIRDPRLPHIQLGYGSRGDELWVKTTKEAISMLNCGLVTWISLDNDLGEGQVEGYAVACFIEEAAYFEKLRRLDVYVHSDNSVASYKMRQAIKNAQRYWSR